MGRSGRSLSLHHARIRDDPPQRRPYKTNPLYDGTLAALIESLAGPTAGNLTRRTRATPTQHAREFAGDLVNAARAAERNLDTGDPSPRAPGRDTVGAGVTLRSAGAARLAGPGRLSAGSAASALGFARRLAAGDHGLARTHWLFGAGVSAAVYVLAALVLAAEATGPAGGWLVLHFVYSTLVWTGIWKAAPRYGGARTWRALARTTVVLVATVLSSA